MHISRATWNGFWIAVLLLFNVYDAKTDRNATQDDYAFIAAGSGVGTTGKTISR